MNELLKELYNNIKDKQLNSNFANKEREILLILIKIIKTDDDYDKYIKNIKFSKKDYDIIKRNYYDSFISKEDFISKLKYHSIIDNQEELYNIISKI